MNDVFWWRELFEYFCQKVLNFYTPGKKYHLTQSNMRLNVEEVRIKLETSKRKMCQFGWKGPLVGILINLHIFFSIYQIQSNLVLDLIFIY